jgi:hypothetical protein
MHFLAAEWVKNGGALPFDPQIQREGVATKYWFTKGVFQMEEKDQVKIALGDSPDLWDAFVLTFAQPVAPRTGLTHVDRGTMKAKVEEEDTAYVSDIIMRAQMEE